MSGDILGTCGAPGGFIKAAAQSAPGGGFSSVGILQITIDPIKLYVPDQHHHVPS